jgi:ubiquinone/menaquinone biosynthesis C-methylase UbiE
MEPSRSDASFAGAVPQLYETLLVPLIFEPYAVDIVARLAARPLTRVLEVAAGTGVVTRRLASVLPTGVAIVATDLNEPMLQQARAVGTARPVEWRQADGMKLPFADASFDAVVCQFGAMFFPDKATAFAEARRVLVAGGVFVFNVWDRIEENEFADTVTAALQGVFPDDPPRFLARTPHGYHEPSTIVQDLGKAGFTAAPRVATVAARSRAASARLVATAYCQGTPLRNEIEARDASRAVEAGDVATAAIATRFGADAVDGKMQALVVSVEA